jgi:hypothetical protein
MTSSTTVAPTCPQSRSTLKRTMKIAMNPQRRKSAAPAGSPPPVQPPKLPDTPPWPVPHEGSGVRRAVRGVA